MSRVFLAEDVRLGRKVVLKVLPGELAGTVSLERFQREIQVAARLQHPHIVPLLDAGMAGDVPYYLMPYLEGESLRARLAREGELPLPEVVRLLREILDALDYAHSQGVVHRDIKPDNILLTAHHAVVTDFGVAKAVLDATSDARLTSTGVALGTPAYMAPEQIAAELTIDHRADIYAVGALAFEMLTGVPPFRGSTTQAILAAHMSQPAPVLTTLRQSIPSELNDVVLRCLEKRPADRWQSTREIVSQLDALTSGSTTVASTSGPRATRTTASRGQAAHPAKVALWFTLASAALLLIVWALVIGLGLPYWVFGGAIALLAVGLPIMLVTSQRERRRESGHPTGPFGHLFTWKRSLQGGVMAFAGLGILAALFMASRALGIGPAATLVSRGVLAPRDRLVIAEFDNHTADTALAVTVTQLLRIDLAQSTELSVLEPAHVALVLARMQRDRATAVTPEVAQEIATREGIKAYLTGEIIPAGTGYVIATRLVSPTSGDALLTLRETVSSPDKLVAAVDRLSARLREGIGESLRLVRADPPLEQVTTSSLEALRLYAEGTRAADSAGYDRAISLLRQAVEVDPSFAMAWRRLGLYAGNAGMLLSPVVDSAVQRAWELRDRLPERERLLVEAARSSTVDRDLERAASVYQSYIDKYPNDAIALNNMGAVLEVLGRSSDALRMYRAAIETRVAPALTYSNTVGVAANMGLIALADSFLAQGQRDFPGASTITESALSLAIDRQEFARADSIAEHVIRTSRELRTSGHLTRASLAQLGGRMGEADRETRAAYASLVERRQLSAEEAAMLVGFSEIERRADYTSDPERLARRLRELWEENVRFSARRRPVARRHMDFAPVFARLGDTTQARRIVQDFDSIMTPSDYPANGARIRHAVVESAVLSAEGRPQEAQAHLREACEQVPNALAICSQMAFLEVAIAFDRAGQADSAIAAYRRFVDLRALRFLSPPRSADLGTPQLAPALRRLGELLEAKGEKQAAIAAYERFLEFWADADPDLQPIVRDVRDRVTRLRRSTG